MVGRRAGGNCKHTVSPRGWGNAAWHEWPTTRSVDYLSEYGHGGIGGIEVLGVGLDGSAVFEDVTLDNRGEGLPEDLVVVERCDEWLECM